MPTFRLATDDDMRAITSSNLEMLNVLPHLYVPVEAVNIPLPPLPFPTEGVGLMREWGIPNHRTIEHDARAHPTALVAPRNEGPFVLRADLLYNGAVPASEFLAPTGASA